jgi:hypothetical protein
VDSLNKLRNRLKLVTNRLSVIKLLLYQHIERNTKKKHEGVNENRDECYRCRRLFTEG